MRVEACASRYSDTVGSEHEVFAEAPLAWVACEIQFPLAPALITGDSFESLVKAFIRTFPIPAEGTVEIAGEMDDLSAEHQFRFFNKARTMSVSVIRSALLVETTRYDNWDAFKSVVVEAIKAVNSLAEIVGVERIGLRYINEIWVPDNIDNAAGWEGWISDDVLRCIGPVLGYTPQSSLTRLRLGLGLNSLEVRYAALTGQGVVSDEPLKRRYPSRHGPFFVIDTDSSCDTSGTDMIDFNPDQLIPVLDELHEPIEAVFQRAITEKSRNLFRGQL